MYKLIVMLRIGICPIGSLIIPESGVNLRELVPGTRVVCIGKKRNVLCAPDQCVKYEKSENWL